MFMNCLDQERNDTKEISHQMRLFGLHGTNKKVDLIRVSIGSIFTLDIILIFLEKAKLFPLSKETLSDKALCLCEMATFM